MSASLSKSVGDMSTSAPVFSYAQAAKGKSPSVPTNEQPAKPTSESAETTPKASPQTVKITNEKPQNVLDEVRNNDVHASSGDNEDIESKQDNIQESEPIVEADAAPPRLQSAVEPATQHTPSAPASPSFGTTSSSALLKEDDVFATPNGSSDSTWDKISQTSQTEEKVGTKVDEDEDEDEDVKLDTWEHVPSPAQLKEAPPPAFNIWQKRALEAKASKESKGPRSLSASNQRPEVVNGRRTLENSPDLGRVDNKKKPRSSPQTNERRIPSSAPLGDENNTYRGIRSPDAVKPVATAAPPPPPGDAISWPTPDTAKEEEKKKAQERIEKGGEKPATKPHVKEKWVAVPYVPTAVFSTPLPPGKRGGRTARGGRGGSFRGGHSVHGSISNGSDEKPSSSNSGPASASTTPAIDRGRGDMGPPRPGPLAPRTKRASSAGASTQREPKPPAGGDSVPQAGARSVQPTRPFGDGRRTSIATQTEGVNTVHQASAPDARHDFQRFRKGSQSGAEREHHINSQDHAHPRTLPERRSEGSMRSPENFRDINGFAHPRERGEGRPERGRGGYRGRGGHNAFNASSSNGQSFPSGQPGHLGPQGYVQPKSHSYTEQGQSSQHQGPPFPPSSREPRHNRNGSRSQPVPNPPNYGRFPTNGSAVSTPSHLPALQTEVANMYGYQPGHPGIMSAMPFHPYMEHVQLLGMVQMQMEYYFSVDNLCKDLYLRKHMDSQGFVQLAFLMKFNRIKQLTTDVELVRFICLRAPTIELQTGVDGVDRVRKVEEWQQWVLNMEERDSAAQNDGPVLVQQAPYSQYAPPEAYRGPRNDGSMSANALSPRGSFASGQYRTEPQLFQPLPSNGINGSAATEGLSNGQISDAHITQTPLSATVPDFTPHMSSLHRNSSPSSDSQVGIENAFSDEQVESLMIVIRKPASSTTPQRASFASPSSRTFSNGSIDGRSISDEISSRANSQAISRSNGDPEPENPDPEIAQRSISPFTFGSAPRQVLNVSPPVFWVKNKDTPVDDLPLDLTHESYITFKHQALAQREQSPKGQCHRDMNILFQFWSHFLIRNFNTRMYEEFKNLAFEDAAERDSLIGLGNLLAYYDETILSQKAVRNELARDYVELAKSEFEKKDRPAFDKLRAAWRNGALPLKNRLKLDKIVDVELKAELDG